MKLHRLLFFIAFLSVISFSCVNAQKYISGKGPKVTKELSLSSFDGIGLSINADVYLRQGPQSVKIEAQQNILDNIKTEVGDDSWNIRFIKKVRHHDGVKIWISIPSLSRIAVSGSGDVKSTGDFANLGDLALAVSGSGNITLGATSQSVKAAISGSGDIVLSGATGDFSVSIAGSGDIRAKDLVATGCNASISGSGDASVHATKKLNVAIVGSGDVVYSGNPSVRSKISGSGDVKSY
ncbi:MAG: head GIN domain-containing protein [Saprospiraceae bacterium]